MQTAGAGCGAIEPRRGVWSSFGHAEFAGLRGAADELVRVCERLDDRACVRFAKERGSRSSIDDRAPVLAPRSASEPQHGAPRGGSLRHVRSDKFLQIALRCLAGLHPPDAGVVAVHGRRLYGSDHRVDAAHRDEVGMVFDTHASIPDRSVLENVRLPLDLRGIDQEEGDARALALLEELGIADAALKRPGGSAGAC